LTTFIYLFVSTFDIWLCPTWQCERLNTNASVYSSKFSLSIYSQIYDILLSSLCVLHKIQYLSNVSGKTEFIKSSWLFTSWENRHKVQVIWSYASHYLYHLSQQIWLSLMQWRLFPNKISFTNYWLVNTTDSTLVKCIDITAKSTLQWD